ncbi:hypothetical protein N8E89_25200 (plasmid) [Phyllobacterium sp. A18/5-2]|uniref:hypothetical protein n=1 Tax=Phyllobacterium sp. A18/5-2 TaxID=2978392 RepID=UPI0021C856B9|nr:hypothetical protein [Phyllobacterium sp. A18/5-2]UXN66426.1 hypothetical protein N8E89_25200 [Phyllobacterium sp. A18/5-2]
MSKTLEKPAYPSRIEIGPAGPLEHDCMRFGYKALEPSVLKSDKVGDGHMKMAGEG